MQRVKIRKMTRSVHRKIGNSFPMSTGFLLISITAIFGIVIIKARTNETINE